MISQFLTEEQKFEIKQKAKEICYEDAIQNPGYLYQIIAQWIDNMSIEDQLLAISSEDDINRSLFDFDPKTGKEWPEE